MKSEDPSFDRLIGGDAVGAVEAAHRRVEKSKRVRHPIRGRRVDGPELIEADFSKIRLLGSQHRFTKYFYLLGVMIGPDYNLG